MAEDARIQRTRKDVTSASLEILLESGWDSVTHSNVAKSSGYSRATIYSHWPNQLDLVRDAFRNYQQMPHYESTGDFRSDLKGELASFVSAMTNFHLERALAMLAERSQVDPSVIDIRDSFVHAGESPIRDSISKAVGPKKVEALTLMLCGMITHAVLMHGEPPAQETIESAIEIALLGIGYAE